MDLDVQVRDAGDGKKTLVTASGEIDAYTAPQLKETVLPETKQKDKTVEVDLEEVSYMDSTGLGVFISALKSANENGSHLRLVNLQQRVARLFSITGLDKVIDVNMEVKGGNN